MIATHSKTSFGQPQEKQIQTNPYETDGRHYETSGRHYETRGRHNKRPIAALDACMLPDKGKRSTGNTETRCSRVILV